MCRVVDEHGWVESAHVEGLCQWCGQGEELQASVEVDHDCGEDAYELLSVGESCILTIRGSGLPLAYVH